MVAKFDILQPSYSNISDRLGVNHDKENDGVVITGYVGKGVAVEIPATIEGFPVMEIGKETFREKKITSITIPNSVTSIGDWAFDGCSNLTTIEIIGDRQIAFGKDVFGDRPLSLAMKAVLRNHGYKE
jgi:hypothetical protein